MGFGIICGEVKLAQNKRGYVRLVDLVGVASRLAYICSRGGAEWMSSKNCGALRGCGGGDCPRYLRRDSRPLARSRRWRRIRR